LGWKYKDSIIEKSDGFVKFRYVSHSVLFLKYLMKIYGKVDVTSKDVIDIGANS